MEDTNSLVGKTALVTGASKGIGRASAIELAAMGANIVVNYNTSEEEAEQTVKLVKSFDVESFSHKANVGDLSEVTKMVSTAEEVFGQVDILVNNAGVIDDGLLLRMKDEAWERVINTNLNGTFYCSRAVLRSMVKARWGRIINIVSVVGIRGNIGQTNYTA